jgi:hypothetical protein
MKTNNPYAQNHILGYRLKRSKELVEDRIPETLSRMLAHRTSRAIAALTCMLKDGHI